jgi:uncharacterized integral membrane protein
MKILGIIILAALLLLAIFTLANWAVLTAPTTLSFVAFEVDGPLGVILLGVTLVLVSLLVMYALTLRTTMLMEAHRHNQALQAQRKLAESAETSRFNELHLKIAQEFTQLRGEIGEIETRIDSKDEAMRVSLAEAANSLAALVGEMDDKLDRVLSRQGT